MPSERLPELADICKARELTSAELNEAMNLFVSSSHTVGEIESWLRSEPMIRRRESPMTSSRLNLSLEEVRILVALLGPIAPIPGSVNLYERLLKFADFEEAGEGESS